MTMDFAALVPYLPTLVTGFAFTILCWALGSILAMGLGLLIALACRSPASGLRRLAQLYIEIMRGTPALLLAFFIYGGGPSVGIFLDPLGAGILTLGIHGSAYFAEIYRVGFNSVPMGHMEAGISLGMSPLDIFVRIQLPEALIIITPSLVSSLIVISKETSLLSIISVPELTFQAQKMGIETFATFETLFALALGYWLLVTCIARAGKGIERRFTAHIADRGQA
jgi:polar amino acid transport system permease protein